MSLHVETSGSGEPLLLIHGWGMHGGVWDTVVPALARDFCVHAVDLPGHGYSPFAAGQEFTLDAVVHELSAQFDGPLNVCGWSLGGIIAQYWATREPDKIKRLVLVASTPCFTERPDWRYGMTNETFRQFSADLARDHTATLRRFLALQVRGSANERELLADLRVRLFSRGEPNARALDGGLQILRDADLRAGLASIAQPALVIAGKRDRLTPPEASRYLASILPHASMVEVAEAAHAPFLSHPDIFVEQTGQFLHG